MRLHYLGLLAWVDPRLAVDAVLDDAVRLGGTDHEHRLLALGLLRRRLLHRRAGRAKVYYPHDGVNAVGVAHRVGDVEMQLVLALCQPTHLEPNWPTVRLEVVGCECAIGAADDGAVAVLPHAVVQLVLQHVRLVGLDAKDGIGVEADLGGLVDQPGSGRRQVHVPPVYRRRGVLPTSDISGADHDSVVALPNVGDVERCGGGNQLEALGALHRLAVQAVRVAEPGLRARNGKCGGVQV
mmetsp:Transcript_38768/g.99138  ORF Transcript_38768/g.99138 Transcript_38768/m.99138 type:complete len:239 (-) Transcript_38768:1031-1747(-)